MTVMLRPNTARPAGVYLEEIAAAAELAWANLIAGRDQTAATRVDEAVQLLQREMPGRRYDALPVAINRLASGCADFERLLCARLLSSIVVRYSARSIPDSIIPGLHRQAMRILARTSAELNDDAFRKDLSICLLLSLPCVAQLIEETGGIPRKCLATGNPRQAMRLLGHIAANRFRFGPYLEIHTHTPMLNDFNPAGWERCYRMAADLLKLRPDSRGLVGGSWFYDPALATISPHLRYLAETPIAGGAFRVRVGSSESDTELAIATSRSRRELVLSGQYRPTRWLLVWPRKALLAWAAQHAGDQP